MQKVFQTRFGGVDAEPKEQGNCFQACIATILGIPLDDAFDCIPFPPRKWFPAFNRWLKQYNLGCIFLEAKDGEVPCTLLVGTHIAECASTMESNTNHAIVMREGRYIHDPNVYANGRGKLMGVYLFVPINLRRNCGKANMSI